MQNRCENGTFVTNTLVETDLHATDA